jgi:hypothetical protein
MPGEFEHGTDQPARLLLMRRAVIDRRGGCHNHALLKKARHVLILRAISINKLPANRE